MSVVDRCPRMKPSMIKSPLVSSAFELPNGSHVDLDMSAGPEQALNNLSKQGVSVFEMRSKVNEYVSQVRNFFKSLSGYNRGKQ